MSVISYDPLMGFKFLVECGEIQGVVGFQKISGMSLDVGVLEVTEVSNPITVTKVPDRVSFSDITLERGVATDTSYDTLWQWFERVISALNNGVAADFRSTVRIRAARKGKSLDGSRPAGDVREWHVYNAFPKAVKFGEFDASSSTVLIESLTLANEGYRLI